MPWCEVLEKPNRCEGDAFCCHQTFPSNTASVELFKRTNSAGNLRDEGQRHLPAAYCLGSWLLPVPEIPERTAIWVVSLTFIAVWNARKVRGEYSRPIVLKRSVTRRNASASTETPLAFHSCMTRNTGGTVLSSRRGSSVISGSPFAVPFNLATSLSRTALRASRPARASSTVFCGHRLLEADKPYAFRVPVVSGKPPAQLFQAVDGHFDKGLGLDHGKGFRAPGSRVNFC